MIAVTLSAILFTVAWNWALPDLAHPEGRLNNLLAEIGRAATVFSLIGYLVFALALSPLGRLFGALVLASPRGLALVFGLAVGLGGIATMRAIDVTLARRRRLA